MDLLEDIIHIDFSFELLNKDFAEFFGNVFLDHKDHLAEAGTDGIINGIIDNGLTRWADPVELFQASITATDTGC